ncbi:MAG: hypothetical protein ACPGSB_08275 [Opitutales bacterium]
MIAPLINRLYSPFCCLLFFFVSLLFLQVSLLADDSSKNVTIRIMLPLMPSGPLDCAVVTRDEEGQWKEHTPLNVRPAFISKWIQVPRTELGLRFQEDGEPLPVLSFMVHEEIKRALVVVLPGEEEGKFNTHIIDGEETTDFGAGDILLVNLSTVTCSVSLGDESTTAKPGDTLVARPSLDSNRMYQLLVGYKDGKDDLVTCHDRYVRPDQSARGYLLLIHDPKNKVRVVRVTEFGKFE